MLAGYAEVSLTPEFSAAGVTGAGKLNTRFSHDGFTTTNVTSGADLGYAMLRQPDGKIVVAGRVHRTTTGSDFGVVRYNTDGSVNLTFGTSGKALTDFAGADDGARDVIIRPSNGKILVVGDATENGVRRMAMARYIP